MTALQLFQRRRCNRRLATGAQGAATTIRQNLHTRSTTTQRWGGSSEHRDMTSEYVGRSRARETPSLENKTAKHVRICRRRRNSALFPCFSSVTNAALAGQ
jgi:hypothetical protein